MKSGYQITIRAFVPCDPMQPETMSAALSEIQRLKTFAATGGADVEVAKTKFVRQRQNGTAPVDPNV